MKYDKYSLADFDFRYAEVYGVHSESSANIYTVALDKKGRWSCGCPRWTRNKNRPECKHIRFIKSIRGQNAPHPAETPMPPKVRQKLTAFSAIEL